VSGDPSVLYRLTNASLVALPFPCVSPTTTALPSLWNATAIPSFVARYLAVCFPVPLNVVSSTPAANSTRDSSDSTAAVR
jgi:hypothetical protein